MATVLPLKQLFTAEHDFTPTANMVKEIVKWRTLYENRGEHAEALNTPLLGCNVIKFLPRDSDALFDILGVNKNDFQSTIRRSSLNQSFIVATDPFNLLVTWAVHKFYNSNMPQNLRNEACMSLFYMMLIRFFSSFVNHMLPHGANRGIMEATIDSLSDKFDIKHADTGTWKLVMMSRATELLDPKNIHCNTIKTFIGDQKITYLITDTQTRIRTKVKLVILEYHKMKESGKTSVDTTLIEEIGDKTDVKGLENSYDSMISSVCNRVLNVNQFIRNDFLKIACSTTTNIRSDMLRELLIKFSTLATYQYAHHKQEDTDSRGRYRGYMILIRNMVQRTYRACIMKKVKMTSKLAILQEVINLYKASRVSDPEILKVKESVEAFVLDTKMSSRDSTRASLKIAFIIYLMLLTFDLD